MLANYNPIITELCSLVESAKTKLDVLELFVINLIHLAGFVQPDIDKITPRETGELHCMHFISQAIQSNN